MDAKDRIAGMMDRRGLTNERLAELIAESSRGSVMVSGETVHRWRNRKFKHVPDARELGPLCRALGCTVEWLVLGREPLPADLSDDERYLLTLARDLELTRQEAARRLSTPAPAPPASLPVPPRPGDAFPAQPEPAPEPTRRRRGSA